MTKEDMRIVKPIFKLQKTKGGVCRAIHMFNTTIPWHSILPEVRI
uniref:Uncharacterized protein n=1 Tax=Rhizophora mucronata TaxID=61149 RepID=A0A2P2R1P8_RHIMU